MDNHHLNSITKLKREKKPLLQMDKSMFGTFGNWDIFNMLWTSLQVLESQILQTFNCETMHTHWELGLRTYHLNQLYPNSNY
jgi:hypothetical protein